MRRLAALLAALGAANEDLKNFVHIHDDILAEPDLEVLRKAVDSMWSFALDSVDNLPEFQYDIIQGGQCRHPHLLWFYPAGTGREVCLHSNKLAAMHILPHVQAAATAWNVTHPERLQLCASFVRRYEERERKSLTMHVDTQAVITANVQLGERGDFDGGLFVYPEKVTRRTELQGQPFFPERGKGSLVVHRSELIHGVELKRGRRYSWITWYVLDMENCRNEVEWEHAPRLGLQEPVLVLEEATAEEMLENVTAHVAALPAVLVAFFLTVGTADFEDEELLRNSNASIRFAPQFQRVAESMAGRLRFLAHIGPPWIDLWDHEVKAFPTVFLVRQGGEGPLVSEYSGPLEAAKLEAWAASAASEGGPREEF